MITVASIHRLVITVLDEVHADGMERSSVPRRALDYLIGTPECWDGRATELRSAEPIREICSTRCDDTDDAWHHAMTAARYAVSEIVRCRLNGTQPLRNHHIEHHAACAFWCTKHRAAMDGSGADRESGERVREILGIEHTPSSADLLRLAEYVLHVAHPVEFDDRPRFVVDALRRGTPRDIDAATKDAKRAAVRAKRDAWISAAVGGTNANELERWSGACEIVRLIALVFRQRADGQTDAKALAKLGRLAVDWTPEPYQAARHIVASILAEPFRRAGAAFSET